MSTLCLQLHDKSIALSPILQDGSGVQRAVIKHGKGHVDREELSQDWVQAWFQSPFSFHYSFRWSLPIGKESTAINFSKILILSLNDSSHLEMSILHPAGQMSPSPDLLSLTCKCNPLAHGELVQRAHSRCRCNPAVYVALWNLLFACLFV